MKNNRKTWLVAASTVLFATSVYAHVTISPPQSKAGATQAYEVRVHNENEKDLATTSIVLDVPDGVTIVSVEKPPSGTFKTAKSGARITTVTWEIAIPANKYVELPFTAKNPAAAKEIVWNVHQHLAGGSVIDWTDKPGAHEHAPKTTITAAAAAPAPATKTAPEVHVH